MTEINLSKLNINHFTLFDAELYCKILNINPDKVAYLDLCNNNLTDISGIGIFKNVELLDYLLNLKVQDLNPLKNMNNLEYLHISNLNLIDEIKTVDILKNLSNLKKLHCRNTFKTLDIRNELKAVVIYD